MPTLTAAQKHPAVLGAKTLLTLRGSVPSKKNALKRRIGNKGHGYSYVQAVRDQIEALAVQAEIQWRPRGATEHPRMEFRFFVAARRKDRDSLYTTILDCLVKARVLVNDNPVSCNGQHILFPVTVVHPRDERVEILVEEG